MIVLITACVFTHLIFSTIMTKCPNSDKLIGDLVGSHIPKIESILNPISDPFTPLFVSDLNPLAESFFPKIKSHLNPLVISFTPKDHIEENNINGRAFIEYISNYNISNITDNLNSLNNSINGEHVENFQKNGKSLIRDTDLFPVQLLKGIREANDKGLVIAHLNINFLYHKFEALNSLVINNIDILILSETKLDDSFPTSEFLISGFSAPFRKDRNFHG